MTTLYTRYRKMTLAAASLILFASLALGGFTVVQPMTSSLGVSCSWTGIATKWVCDASPDHYPQYQWRQNGGSWYNGSDSMGFYCDSGDVVSVRAYTGSSWTNTASAFCGGNDDF